MVGRSEGNGNDNDGESELGDEKEEVALLGAEGCHFVFEVLPVHQIFLINQTVRYNYCNSKF